MFYFFVHSPRHAEPFGVTSQTDLVSGEKLAYTYDALNRLASAQTTQTGGTQWGQSYNYDGFGNLTDQNVTLGSAPSMHVVYSAATNRQTGDSADANGNIGVTGSTYDIENRLVTANNGQNTYAYDPGNKRMWRGDNSGTDEIDFWGATGQKLATYHVTTTSSAVQFALLTTNVYFGKKLASKGAANTQNGTTDCVQLTPVASDRLGSIGKFYPYGQEKPSATQNDTEKFTGYFRDQATGLDYADQRYHQPGVGRFMTPDFAPSTKVNDPGSWNKYAYVGGDPVNRVDPHGKYWCATIQCRAGLLGDHDDDVDEGSSCGGNNLFANPPCYYSPGQGGGGGGSIDCNALVKSVGFAGLTYSNASEIWNDGNLSSYSNDSTAATVAALAAVTWQGENSFKLGATNNLNKNGTVDIGPFQLNYQTWGKIAPPGVFGTNVLGGQTFIGSVAANINFAVGYLENLLKTWGDNAAGVYVDGHFKGKFSDNAAQRESTWKANKAKLTTLFQNQDCFTHQ
jgi:RHS repeat-associated protein